MSTLAERMQEFSRETGWSIAEIAAIAKVSHSAVSQWMGKGAKEIKSIAKIDSAIYLERASGFSALWLAKGLGPRKAAIQPAAAAMTLEQMLEAIGLALEKAPALEARQGAESMLQTFIANPSANMDVVPLIARRLSGERPLKTGTHSH
ncbi:hypothetical protein [Variovorax paradoxus]|uniref:hypothetical protein n=1 Tax=Variovorax paradoxus TaxID=34073 RepID=UPI0019328133|nr:hypothetical protein INQ48_18150 [Variovorax paradoxus]